MELKSFRTQGAGAAIDELQLGGNAAKTAAKVETSREVKDNYRFWTVSSSGRDRRIWAEYAGTVGNEVVLRPLDKPEIRTHLSGISDDDREWIRLGRWWQLPDSRQSRAQYGGQIGRVVKLKNSDGETVAEVPIGSLSPEDQQWIRDRPSR